MSRKAKCTCIVHDNFSFGRRGRLCKGKVWNNIGGKSYCYIHAKKKFTESVITIQKYQRGKRSRQLLNNIYIRLPIEIQCIIDNYVNKEINIKRQINIINKIIQNRFISIEHTIIEIRNREHLIIEGNLDLDWSMLYNKLTKDLISILSIINNNWKNINLIINYELNKYFLIKLFTLAKYDIWENTFWNNISLQGLTNYLSIESQDIELRENAAQYFILLTQYWSLFVFTFNIKRNQITGKHEIIF